MKYAVISLSGGLDSSTLLLRLLHEGYIVKALSFNYGQKHLFELDCASKISNILIEKKFNISYSCINISDISGMLESSLVAGGADIPVGKYSLDGMQSTVVPNRNKIFSSIIQACALSLSKKYGQSVKIAMGVHAGDSAVYPDCRTEFRDADYKAFLLGNWDAENVEYYTPYINKTKTEVLSDGLLLTEKLGIDFNEYYGNTFTSYNPINVLGKTYSDYKSASSISRVEAFANINKQDPAIYADESGIVSWNWVLDYVKKELNNSFEDKVKNK